MPFSLTFLEALMSHSFRRLYTVSPLKSVWNQCVCACSICSFSLVMIALLIALSSVGLTAPRHQHTGSAR